MEDFEEYELMKEIYVSTDIEANGPIPGLYSMLSFGSAAYTPDGTLVSTFSRNLKTLANAGEDASTMKWWAGQGAAYQKTRENQVDPFVAMSEYVEWIKTLGGTPVFVGYPVTFDFMFIYWYLIATVGHSPFSFSALDIKTYAMAILGTEFRKSTKRKMPKEWFASAPKHSHVALDDAIEQGELFCAMLRERNGS